jgi:ferritin-like metal-binding protein YciE
MEMDNLRELLVDELKDIYNAEQQLTKALPRMAKKASHPQLKNAFETHLRETEAQVDRLEQVFEALGEKAKGKTCAAMKGILEEGKEIMGEDMDDDVMDAALIAAAQKVEHYEIASYGTVRAWAQLLGERDAVKLLQQTLDEEGKTDKLLTKLAESTINVEAEA